MSFVSQNQRPNDEVGRADLEDPQVDSGAALSRASKLKALGILLQYRLSTRLGPIPNV